MRDAMDTESPAGTRVRCKCPRCGNVGASWGLVVLHGWDRCWRYCEPNSQYCLGCRAPCTPGCSQTDPELCLRGMGCIGVVCYCRCAPYKENSVMFAPPRKRPPPKSDPVDEDLERTTSKLLRLDDPDKDAMDE